MDYEEKLSSARCRLLAVSPFYGQAAMGMRWTASEMPWKPEDERTMGVRVLEDGVVECLYYPPFVDRLPVVELSAVVQHEIEHVLRLHCVRRGDRDPRLYNIAADMCVNGPRWRPRIGLPADQPGEVALPLGGDLIWIPPGWPDDATAEAYYERLRREQEPPIGGLLLDDHAVWDQSTASPEEARETARALAIRARDLARGRVPGHLAEVLEGLEASRVSWESVLRRFVQRRLSGGRRRSSIRPSRRRDGFGVPGVTRRAQGSVNVVVDTSASVSRKMLERFFAEIDHISRAARVSVLQWDHAFQGYAPYRPGDRRTWKIRGRGGTDMAAPFRWLEEHRRLADVQILLTDGFANWPARAAHPLITAIPDQSRQFRIFRPPPWGEVIYLDD